MKHEVKLGRDEGERSLVEELLARGVRMTKQRRLLLELIENAGEHVNAQALIQRAQRLSLSVDRATVYRTLELLKRHELVDELDLMHVEGHQHYYEPRYRKQHLHLICLSCSKVVELSTESLERLKAEVARQTGFDLSTLRLEIGGYCSECRRKVRAQKDRSIKGRKESFAEAR